MRHALLVLLAVALAACGGGNSSSPGDDDTVPTSPSHDDTKPDQTPAAPPADEAAPPAGDTPAVHMTDGDKKITGVCVTGMYVEIGEKSDGTATLELSYPKYSDEDYQPGTFGETFKVSTEGADDVLGAIEARAKSDVLLKKRPDGRWDIVDEEDCPPLPEA